MDTLSNFDQIRQIIPKFGSYKSKWLLAKFGINDIYMVQTGLTCMNIVDVPIVSY